MEQMILSPIPFDQLSTLINNAVQSGIQAFADKLQPIQEPVVAPEYLTRAQTASRLGISLVTLNEWTKTGKLQGYRIGTRVRYKAEEIDAALKAIRTTKSR